MTLHFSDFKIKIVTMFIKQSLLIIFLFTSIVAFPQINTSNDFKDKYEEFDFYASPDKTNKLSRFFRNRIDTRMLKVIKFKEKDLRKQRVFLRFSLNSDNEPVYVKVSSPYSELNTSIEEAFKRYDIKKLNIPEINPLNGYLLQIISMEGNTAIVNCNTTIIYDRFPVFEGCESVTNYGAMRKCINKQLEKHIVATISATELENAKVFGAVKLFPRFSVNDNGTLNIIKSVGPTKNLTKELDRIIALFPGAKTPAMRNGNPTTIFIKGNVVLQVGSTAKDYEDKVIQSKNKSLKTDNDLALYFKKHITEKELKNIAFFKKQQDIKISFGINKKGKLVDVKTTLRNIKMNAKLVRLFKKYPLEKLEITASDIKALYRYTIITKSVTKNVIQCNDKPNVSVFPVFNKKCDKSTSDKALRKCFTENISALLKKKFNTKLANKTNLTGKIRMIALIKVDKLGAITVSHVRAPNPFLSNWIEETLNAMSVVYKPGVFNEEIESTKIGVPIVFNRRSNANNFETAKTFRTKKLRY